MFKKLNVNPKGKKTGDCVIRAIAYAEGKEWLVVYDELSALARTLYTVPNNKDCYGKYLDDKYIKINAMVNIQGKKKRLTPSAMSKFNGTYIMQQSGHLTVIENGICVDSWDCSEKSAYKIWKVK